MSYRQHFMKEKKKQKKSLFSCANAGSAWLVSEFIRYNRYSSYQYANVQKILRKGNYGDQKTCSGRHS